MAKIARSLRRNGLLIALLSVLLCSCQPANNADQFSGYIEAELIYLAAPQSGWLSQQSWQAGDHIPANQLAFALDDEQQQALVAQAQANLAQAKALERNAVSGARAQELDELYAQRQQAQVALDFAQSEQQRWSQIVAQGLAPQSKATQVNADTESASARLKSIEASIAVAKLGAREELINSALAAQKAAEAALQQASWQLAQRRVNSAVSGQIEEIFYRQGEFVTAGKPVMAILPPDALLVRSFVDQDQLSRFTVGGQLHIYADGIDQPIAAQISHIARSAEFTPPVIYDQQTRQKLKFLVEARIKEPQLARLLHPGLPVSVRPQ